MKQLSYKEPWTNKEPVVMDVQHALEHYVDRRNYADGAIESVSQQVNGTLRMLGNLAQVLADKGILQEADFLRLLDDNYTLIEKD